jgi:hypothetical protein
MPITGLRHTGNFQGDQRPKNWRETILLLKPNGKAPLTALTSMMKSASTDDPEFSWFEKPMPSQRLQLSADLTAVATTIALVGGADNLKTGHVIRVEHTDELLYVTADPTNLTSMVVQRAFAGSTAAPVTVASQNPFVHVVGSAYEEGSEAPTGVNYDPTKQRNYTQIFRNTLEMTRTAQKSRLRTGDQVKEAKRECLELHSIEMEKAFFFGRPFEGTRNGKPLRTTGGVINWIDPANVVNNADGSINMLELEGWLERIFRFGSTEKMAFCGNAVVLGINQAIRRNSQFQIMSGIKEYGMNVMRLVCPFGELVIKTHPLFNQITSSASPNYNALDSWMVVLDMDNIRYRPFDGADTKWEGDLQANGLDGMKAGYLSECGLEVNHASTHFLIRGIRSGVVDA